MPPGLLHDLARTILHPGNREKLTPNLSLPHNRESCAAPETAEKITQKIKTECRTSANIRANARPLAGRPWRTSKKP
jgi:hypothetical protein